MTPIEQVKDFLLKLGINYTCKDNRTIDVHDIGNAKGISPDEWKTFWDNMKGKVMCTFNLNDLEDAKDGQVKFTVTEIDFGK